MTKEELEHMLNEHEDNTAIMLARAFERLQKQLIEMESRIINLSNKK